MKFIVSVLLTALIAFAAGIFLPWWSIAVAGFLVAVIVPQKAFKSFLSGFLGIFLLWAVLSLWIDQSNQGILLQRVAALFKLNNAAWLLFLITALIGGLIGGFAALTGSYVRK